MSKALSTIEVQRLEECEHRIAEGKLTFVDVGLALQEIKDRKLYRATYKTFAQYCEQKWNFCKSYAYNLIGAAKITTKLIPEAAENLSTIVDKIPNEAVARELGKVPKSRRKKVLDQASKDGPPTAKGIANAAKQYPPVPPPLPAPVPKTNTKPEPKYYDKVGRAVPTWIEPLWEKQSQPNGLLEKISEVRTLLRPMQESQNVLYAEVSIQRVVGLLDDAYTELKQAIPYAICPYCQGQQPKTLGEGGLSACRNCNGRGFISKFRWDTVVDPGLKEIIFKTIAKKKS